MRPNGSKLSLPVELVKEIQKYYVAPVRERLTREWEVGSRCFRNDCSRVDRIRRGPLTAAYNLYVYSTGRKLLGPTEDVMDLTDGMVSEISRHLAPYPIDPSPMTEDGKNVHNKRDWLCKFKGVFSKKKRSMFEERFGLDIWFSHVVLEGAELGFGPRAVGNPHATVAYLTLPRITRKKK